MRWTSLALAAAVWGLSSPAAAQVSDESFAVNARAHAHALKTAYYRLEDFILRRSTAATSWSGATPPAGTGWLDAWTERGLRARYCADAGQPGTLLVYMGVSTLMGVGDDQRSVRSGPRLFGGERRNLHWLENGVALGGDGRPDIALPSCMANLVPSERAALAGSVQDPWTATRSLTAWERRELLACPAGTHRPPGLGASDPARIERRQVTTRINGRGTQVGSPQYGAWTIAVDLCEADYAVTETEHRPCTYTVAGETVSGYEIWRRTKSVTAGGESGVWSMMFTTCQTGPIAQAPTPTGTPETMPQPTITFPTWTETESITCRTCTQGSASRSRIHTDRHVKFPWDATPTIQKDVQITQWVRDYSGCSPIPDTVWTTVRTETRTVSCGSGYTGSVTQQRSVTDRHTRPCGGTVSVSSGVSATTWSTIGGGCTRIPDPPPPPDNDGGNDDTGGDEQDEEQQDEEQQQEEDEQKKEQEKPEPDDCESDGCGDGGDAGDGEGEGEGEGEGGLGDGEDASFGGDGLGSETADESDDGKGSFGDDGGDGDGGGGDC